MTQSFPFTMFFLLMAIAVVTIWLAGILEEYLAKWTDSSLAAALIIMCLIGAGLSALFAH